MVSEAGCNWDGTEMRAFMGVQLRAVSGIGEALFLQS